MKWNEIVAANVRRLRVGRQLTQEQLALDAQLDLTYIGGIERGRRFAGWPGTLCGQRHRQLHRRRLTRQGR